MCDDVQTSACGFAAMMTVRAKREEERRGGWNDVQVHSCGIGCRSARSETRDFFY